MILLNLLLFGIGLILLGLSADFLIKSSVRLALLLKLSVLFIGLILIAFGTSLPEAAVSIVAALKDQRDIAIGNVVGSNIANIGLVMGVLGWMKPVKINDRFFKAEIPIMLAATLAFYVMALDGVLGFTDGAIMIIGFIIFCFVSYKIQQKDENIAEDDERLSFKQIKSVGQIIGIFAGSLVLLIIASNLMVLTGVNIAESFGVAPWLIGVTLFSVGTSLPELATCIAAHKKNISSISVGNVIGSNIFNILFVIGLVSMLRPISVDAMSLKFEFPAMIVFSFLVVALMRHRYVLDRFKAGILLSSYGLFLLILVWLRI